MPRLSVLIDDFAERFSFERSKLNGLARTMREAGLLTSGARGVNAPSATPMDAARLLIAMMLNSAPPSVVEDVQLVGSFAPLNPDALPAGFKPDCLEHGLALLIEYAGKRAVRDVAMTEVIQFQIIPHAAIAEIHIHGARRRKADLIGFSHPDMVGVDLAGELPESYRNAVKRFPTGFYQKPLMANRELLAVGALVMGDDE